MNKTETYRMPIKWVAIHIMLGLVFALFKSGVQFWFLGVAIYGIISIQKNKDRGFVAARFAAYVAGIEVLLRMAGSALPYEIGKYIVIIFLLYGRMCGKANNRCQWVWAVFLLLIPAVIQTLSWSNRIRIDILANMSGMISLLVAVAYFYEKQMDFYSFKRIIGWLILPLTSMGAYLFVVTPDFDKILYQSAANFETSGGFGPNQVSSVLGFGWLMVLFFIISDNGYTKSKLLDFGLFSYLVFRALFTFSRGGNVGALLSFIAFILIGNKSGNKKLFSSKTISGLIVAALSVVLIVSFLNEQTDNVFMNRYTGKNTYGGKVVDVTANRSTILDQELKLFSESPLGLGFGGSQFYRQRSFGGIAVMSHNEFGRLLCENGIFGIMIIVILLLKSIQAYSRNRENYTNGWLMAVLIYSLSIMMHSAMRIAMPGLLYGLSLVTLYYNKTTNERKRINNN